MARVEIANPRNPFFLAVVLRLLVAAGVVAGVAGAGAALAAYVWLAHDLPPIPPFEAIRFGTVTQVRANHGQVLAEMFRERRYLVPMEGIPKVVLDAFLASEDERFFEHHGLDLRGIARAIWTNLRRGEVREGASTITQQLARSLLLTREKSLRRKVREAIVARRLEDIYTKDQILLLYLNLIYLGDGSYGVQAASRTCFGKDLSELDLAEAAALATLPQSPGTVTPLQNPAETRVRRDRVLRRMREAGFITLDQEAAARDREVRAAPGRDNLGDRAPVPASEAMAELKALLPRDEGTDLLMSEGGVTAWTTVDLGLQRAAQDAVLEGARAMDRRQGWRGPLATLPGDDWEGFARRNGAWLSKRGWGDPPMGPALLALVVEVGPAEAKVRLAPDLDGTLPLANLAWAAPYTEFPIKDPATAARTEAARVSLDGRVEAVDKVLNAGDVILVARVKPPAPKAPEPPKPEPKKKKKKKGKKAPIEEPPPPSPPPEPPPPTGPYFTLLQFPRVQAAMLAVEPRSGYVQAEVGGTDWDVSQVNRTESLRQSGSTIKPVYYAKAFDAGLPPSTIISGAPFRAGEYAPEGDRAVDELTAWMALTRSENNCSLRVFQTVLDRVGLDGLNDWAARLGLTRPFQGYPAEALGVDLSPRDLAAVYATFATGGIRQPFVRLKRVVDGTGRTLLDRRSPRDPTVGLLDALALEVASPPEASRRAITAEAAFLVAMNLRNVAEEGTARATRKLTRPLQGKTGTLPYDVWFAGWSHELTAVSWVGQDLRERYLGRSRQSGNVFGADTALPPWAAFVRSATAGRPAIDDLAEVPEGIVMVTVDPRTGLLAGPEGIPIPHLRGTEPTEAALQPVEEEVTEF